MVIGGPGNASQLTRLQKVLLSACLLNSLAMLLAPGIKSLPVLQLFLYTVGMMEVRPHSCPQPHTHTHTRNHTQGWTHYIAFKGTLNETLERFDAAEDRANTAAIMPEAASQQPADGLASLKVEATRVRTAKGKVLTLHSNVRSMWCICHIITVTGVFYSPLWPANEFSHGECQVQCVLAQVAHCFQVTYLLLSRL